MWKLPPLWNLRFPQQRCWVLKPTRMWYCIMKWVLSDIFNKHRAFNFTKRQLLVGLLDPNNKGTAVLWSTGNYSTTDTAPHPTRSETSSSPLYEILGSQGVSITVNQMEYGAIPTSIWKREAACPLDISVPNYNNRWSHISKCTSQ